MNHLAKGLVLVHVVMSVAGMTLAIILVLQGRDFGWIEPAREVLERKADGAEVKIARYASEYDKSIASMIEAKRTRDTTMVHVQPALDSIRATEPFLPNNHLFYEALLKQLSKGDGKFEIKRLQDMGWTLEQDTGKLGKPVLDKKEPGIDQSYLTYNADLDKVLKEIDKVEADIRKIVVTTKIFTEELTGTVEGKDPLKDPAVYVYPGLYQMTDLEFKAQTQLKIEIDAIKPNWSKAVEHAGRFQSRRIGLEKTLELLTVLEPKNLKK